MKKILVLSCLIFGFLSFSAKFSEAGDFVSVTNCPPPPSHSEGRTVDIQTRPVESYDATGLYRSAHLTGRSPGCDLSFAPPCGPNAFRSRLKLYGWFEAGFFLNGHGDTSEHYRTIDRSGRSGRWTAAESGNSNLLGNVRSTEPSVNQLWVGLRRDLDLRKGFDWGFRADWLFGTDAWLAQSFGDATFDYDMNFHRDYYVAVPRLYAAFGYKKFSMKVGKFESLLGYETLEAPDGFFYSHSNLFYTMPQTHSGVLGEYRFHPTFRVAFGYVLGADNSFDNRFDDHGFLGAVYWKPVSSLGICYSLYVADRGDGYYRNGEPHYGGTIFQHSLVLDWRISHRWNYVFEWSLGDRDGNGRSPKATYFGTAHYLTYCFNRSWKIGLRLEQVHANQMMTTSGFGTPFTGNYEGDLFGVSLGLNWTPTVRLSVRPELRYDRAGDCKPFDRGRSDDQFSAGCGVVYVF